MEPRGGKRWQPVENPKRPKTAETRGTVAVRCDRLRLERMVSRASAVSYQPLRGPLPAKEGVDLDRRLPRLLLAAALGAWALVAAAAGACLADHGSILLRCSFGRLRA
jgi:hypothetical protein